MQETLQNCFCVRVQEQWNNFASKLTTTLRILAEACSSFSAASASSADVFAANN